MRVKLAFFLAMMRLGSDHGLGRHPRFLLVDQPGSAEIVPEDFEALAKVFRNIDEQMENELQIICFTARPAFMNATKANKISGPKSGKFAF